MHILHGHVEGSYVDDHGGDTGGSLGLLTYCRCRLGCVRGHLRVTVKLIIQVGVVAAIAVAAAAIHVLFLHALNSHDGLSRAGNEFLIIVVLIINVIDADPDVLHLSKETAMLPFE